MQQKTDKDAIIKEFELLISDFLSVQENDEIFFELTAKWGLYLSLNHLRKLVDDEDLFKVDEYLSYFVTFVSLFFDLFSV